MEVLLIKLLLALIILAVALIGGIYPILANATGKARYFLNRGDLFARGIFLGAGLIHLLPDAQEKFSTVSSSHYPYVYVISAGAIVSLYFIDRLLTNTSGKANTFNWIPFLLTIILGIHSIIEGAALGIVSEFDTFIIIFIAIIAHKGSAAFALAMNMRTHNLARQQMLKLIGLFSLMTPIGILLGSIISKLLSGNVGSATEACFNAIAAGTFIYIAIFDQETAKTEITFSAIEEVLLISLGIALMAIVAVWV